MTWLSRLLPQGHDSQRAIDRHRNRRIRQGRRRRISALEPLEGRIVLNGGSVVTATQDLTTGIVTLAGDPNGDWFKVTLNNNDTVSVVGIPQPNSPLPGSSIKTQINTNPLGTAWTSLLPASGLNITLPGAYTLQNGDNVQIINGTSNATHVSQLRFINITENNGTTVTGNEALTVNVLGINAQPGPGTFTLTDGTATSPGGKLDATVTTSTFSGMAIAQTGCCPAHVTLTNDTVPGGVMVSEGLGDGDYIHLLGTDHFGPTKLTQGNPPTSGPGSATGTGAGDNITVFGPSSGNLLTLTNLTATQLGTGGGQSILVGTDNSSNIFEPDSNPLDNTPVLISNVSFGVRAYQLSAGGGDTIKIVSVTDGENPPSNNIGSQGGPASIYAQQGDGKNETIEVDASHVFGNITAIQGNGVQDLAAFTGDTAGWVDESGPTWVEHNGTATIQQGNGTNDKAILDCATFELSTDSTGLVSNDLSNYFNNVVITQGDGSITTKDCVSSWNDLVSVNCTYITSDLTIQQGTSASGDPGNNLVAIGDTSQVVVGDSTKIDEFGSNNVNNQIYLGGANDPSGVDFCTGTLDIWTGAGGAYVSVMNTNVLNGALGTYGSYNINGGGTGNTSSIDFYSYFFGGVTSQF